MNVPSEQVYQKWSIIHRGVHILKHTLKWNAAYFLKKIIMDENDALSENNKISLGHNRTNGAVYCKIYFKVEICSAH